MTQPADRRATTSERSDAGGSPTWTTVGVDARVERDGMSRVKGEEEVAEFEERRIEVREEVEECRPAISPGSA